MRHDGVGRAEAGREVSGAKRRAATPRRLSAEEQTELYSDLCDAVCREALGIPDDDPFKHTSDVSRATANRIMRVLVNRGLLDGEAVRQNDVANLREFAARLRANGAAADVLEAIEERIARLRKPKGAKPSG